ncbi:MAG: ATP-binding protein, partial [Candidatus Dormibacteraeota bacterium]|nr:ATP-binding protein [Candidatus Dormibacteraeota bacterium]
AVEAHQSLRVEVCCEGEMECSAEVQEAVYRIAQEALANVIRHARASSVSVDLGAGEDGRLVLEVADDGVGFDGCLEQPGHLGQRSMAERATALGGRLEVASRAGGGTTVRAEIPCMQPGGPSAQ